MKPPAEHPLVRQLRPLLRQLERTEAGASEPLWPSGKSGGGHATFHIATAGIPRRMLPPGVAKMEKTLGGPSPAEAGAPVYSVVLRGRLDRPTLETSKATKERMQATGPAGVSAPAEGMWLMQVGCENPVAVDVHGNFSRVSAANPKMLLAALHHWLLQNEENAKPLKVEIYGDRKGACSFEVGPEHVREYLGLKWFADALSRLKPRKRPLATIQNRLGLRDRTTLLTLSRLLEARAEELGVTPPEAFSDKVTQGYLYGAVRSLHRHRLGVVKRLKAERTVPWHET